MKHQRSFGLTGLRQALCALTALAVVSCGGATEDVYEEQPVDALYNVAMEKLLDQEYLKAADSFEEVERQHPYSVWASKAQVMSAYAYFRRDRYDDAINAVDRFIQLHPTSVDAPYAYYLKGLAYYEQIVDVGRDQRTTERALRSLEEVVRRFPETQYARDATLKLDLTKDHLAGKEMDVGRFYLKRGELLAAVNRFKRVIEEHQTTSHVPEALLRLTEAYKALGLTNEARRMAAILGHNYPGSPWYADAYELVEGVELENFPRPDKRQFYERWIDPDSMIAKAERREIPQFAATLPEDLKNPKPKAVEAADPDEANAPAVALAVKRKPLTQDKPEPEAKAAPATVAPKQAAPKPAAPKPIAPKPVAPEVAVIAPGPASAAPAVVAARPTPKAEPDPEPASVSDAPPRPLQLSPGERAALSAEAESQRLAASEAAGEWRRAADVASTDEGRTRALANVHLAEAAEGYWAARGEVAAASTSSEEAAAELKLAKQSVKYWTAVRDATEDNLSRQQANAALDQAEKVLAYWRENGRRPTWLERTVRSLS